MTYQFRLSRELTTSRLRLLLPLLYLIALPTACGEPTFQEGFVPPDPSDPVAIEVAPEIDTIQATDSLQLQVIGINAEGNAVPAEVDWFASGGTISAAGVFQSANTGQFTLVARHRRHHNIADTAVVVVIPGQATVAAVVVSPSAATLATGASRTFSASATMSDGASAPVAVTWTATGGTISASGQYTAGGSAGTYRVIADENAGSHADTATITITAPTLTAVVVSPGTASLATGGTQQFAASGRLSDGSTSTVTVNWTATGGSVNSAGLYTAGTTAGNFRVIATNSGGSLADTALIGVAVPAPTLQQIILTPSTATLLTGAAQQYAVSGRMSDGSSKSVTATYTATGGTITAGGLYTAGTTAGSYRVISTLSGGTMADTGTVTVTAPTLQQVVLTPSSTTLLAGTLKQFSASGRLTDGSVSTVSVTYNATGGTITTAGLYTAGTSAGTYRVIATQSGGTLADTSAVTVTAATLTSVIVLPATATVASGTTKQFTVSGTLNNGATTTPAVTYSATGGTISSGGLYTAGSSAGAFRVVAVQQGGTLADTAAVTVTVVQAPTLTKVILSPGSTSLLTSATQQFSVSGQMSDGSTTVPAVNYSATGGTVTTGGKYTAGVSAGTFRVIAVQQGGTLADTASIVLSVPGVGGEPVYVAGVNTLVYKDNFDSYHMPLDGSGTPNQATFPTSARMETNGTYPSDPSVYHSASLATPGRDGTGHALRSNNTLGNEGQNPQSSGVNWHGPQGSGVVLPPKSAKHVFQYWFKTNPGGGPNGNGGKWFEWWANGSAIPSTDVRMQFAYFYGDWAMNDQLGRFSPNYAKPPVGPHWNQVNDGNWHRITIAWLSPSGAATRDGYLRGWIDGIKMIDVSQSAIGVTPSGGTKAWCTQSEVDAMASFQTGHFQAWPEHVNGANADWSLWVDDFSWWTEP
jgi:hypothetical protein